MRRKKFNVIVSHPIQYHAVLWRNLAQIEELDFQVLFCSDHGQEKSLDKEFGVAFKWDIPLKDRYMNRTFKNLGFGNGFFKYINPGLILHVLFNKTDYTYLHGVNNFTAYFAFWISKIKGAKTIIRNIAHCLDQDNNSTLKFRLKNLIYGSVFRNSNICLYIGEHNKAFYQKFKVDWSKLLHAPHVVDNDFFQQKRLTNSQKVDFKNSLNIDNECIIILFCGKLIPKKQPEMLLDAFIDSVFINKVALVFVGEGVLRPHLEQKANEYLNQNQNIKDIKFLGFKNQTELPPIYSISDVLVLPSFHQETWGLVVNETLNFSTAIIVSDNVGCGPELVENKTGYIFNRNSCDELKFNLENIINNKGRLTLYKENAQKIINSWSVKEYIDSIRKIINE